VTEIIIILILILLIIEIEITETEEVKGRLHSHPEEVENKPNLMTEVVTVLKATKN